MELPSMRENPNYSEKRIEKGENESISISEETKSRRLQVML
jgi:hypothetical protein